MLKLTFSGDSYVYSFGHLLAAILVETRTPRRFVASHMACTQRIAAKSSKPSVELSRSGSMEASDWPSNKFLPSAVTLTRGGRRRL